MHIISSFSFNSKLIIFWVVIPIATNISNHLFVSFASFKAIRM